MLLSACSTCRPLVVREVERLTIPGALTAATPQPPAPASAEATNEDLLKWAIDLRASLKEANADKDAIRVWAGQ